eukprot:3745064-Pleurochrysis_carterae.AAC.2
MHAQGPCGRVEAAAADRVPVTAFRSSHVDGEVLTREHVFLLFAVSLNDLYGRHLHAVSRVQEVRGVLLQELRVLRDYCHLLHDTVRKSFLRSKTPAIAAPIFMCTS